jgi:tetratricopeptide (TPR) repeat protein
LAADIHRFLNHEPVSARPPSFGYLLRRFVSRHRGAVAAAAALLATLIGGLALSTTMFFRERTARAEAETSAIKSQQVAKLLKEMLSSAGPSKAQGKDATMLKEILDAFAARLSHELADQPDVESELRMILGETYEDLGEFELARDQYQLALDIRRRTLSTADPRIADSLYGLASALDYLDDLTAAEAALNEMIEIQVRQPNPNLLRIAEARDLMAWLLFRVGDIERAEQESRAATEIFRESGDEHRETLAMGINTLGTILLRAAKFAESEQRHREAIEIYRQTVGLLHPKMVTAMNNLCHTLVKIGSFAEAEQTAREALALEEKITRQKLNHCTDSLHKALAEVYAARGDFDAAVEALAYAVQAASEVYGPNHRFTNDKRSLLAQMQVRAGRLDAARQTLGDARNAGGGASAEHSLEVASAKLELADGKLDDAERYARAALANARNSYRSPSVELVEPLQTLAAVLAAKREWTEAESLLREAIQLLRPDLNPNCPMMVSLQADLAKATADVPQFDPK